MQFSKWAVRTCYFQLIEGPDPPQDHGTEPDWEDVSHGNARTSVLVFSPAMLREKPVLDAVIDLPYTK